MALNNKTTDLLKKMENRLGTKVLNLPETICKDKWMEDVIIPDTLTEFSRYYPAMLPYKIDKDHPKKDGWYLLDEAVFGDREILGVKDIDFFSFGNSNLSYLQDTYGAQVDFMSMSAGFSFEDMAMLQMKKDHSSLFNMNIYIDFEPPNRFKVSCFNNRDIAGSIGSFNVLVHLKHADNLTTISPTMMSIFEDLCMADVARYLYNFLRYYDGIENVNAGTIDLKLSDFEKIADTRDNVIQTIKDSYVSWSNSNQPMIMVI